MANPDYEKLQTGDETLNRIQDNARDASNRTSTIGRGNQVKGVEFSGLATPVEVPHQLGRRFEGGTCVKCQGTAAVHFVVQESDVDPDKFFKVTPSGPFTGTADFWVF